MIIEVTGKQARCMIDILKRKIECPIAVVRLPRDDDDELKKILEIIKKSLHPTCKKSLQVQGDTNESH